MLCLTELGSHAKALHALARFTKTLQGLQWANGCWVELDFWEKRLKGEDTETKRGLYKNRGREEAGT